MSLIEETDFGTPRSKSEKMVTLTIDGQSVTVPEGSRRPKPAGKAREAGDISHSTGGKFPGRT